MTNREEANKLASKITGETVNAGTTKEALEAIGGKSAGSMAEALENIVQGDIPSGGGGADLLYTIGDTDGYFNTPRFIVADIPLPHENASYEILYNGCDSNRSVQEVLDILYSSGVVWRYDDPTGKEYIDVDEDYVLSDSQLWSDEKVAFLLKKSGN